MFRLFSHKAKACVLSAIGIGTAATITYRYNQKRLSDLYKKDLSETIVFRLPTTEQIENAYKLPKNSIQNVSQNINGIQVNIKSGNLIKHEEDWLYKYDPKTNALILKEFFYLDDKNKGPVFPFKNIPLPEEIKLNNKIVDSVTAKYGDTFISFSSRLCRMHKGIEESLKKNFDEQGLTYTFLEGTICEQSEGFIECSHRYDVLHISNDPLKFNALIENQNKANQLVDKTDTPEPTSAVKAYR